MKKESLDPYVVTSKRPLGHGAYGEIYSCQHKVTGRKYALKVIRIAKIEDIKLANLFLCEIIIMLEMNTSPYTVGLEDYFVYNNDLHLVIEYCDGGDLHSFIRMLNKKRKKLSFKDLQMIAWNVGLGLNEMHNRKIMHRDVKPGNVLVIKEIAKDGTVIPDKLASVKLCDYGLSKKVQEWQELHGITILGTYEYFAPELYDIMERRLLGEQITAKYNFKIDVWSYGVLLYFTLYNKTPLDPPGSKYIVMQRKKILYPKMSDIPESFFKFLKRIFTHEVSKRPSFAELLRDHFFFDFVFKERENMYPYEKGELIRVEDDSRVYECKVGGEIYELKIVEITEVDKKKIQGEVVSLLELKDCENIVHLYDYFSIGSTINLVMDHFEDGDLATYIHKREQLLNSDEQLFIAYCIIKALFGIHNYNLMHRRLNPRSVFIKLESDGSIKDVILGDFSYSWTCAGDIDFINSSGVYSSPELVSVKVKRHDSKTDIWSYGMILYLIIFGINPDEYLGNQNVAEIMRTGNLLYDTVKAESSKELVKMMKDCVRVNPITRPTALLLMKDMLFEKYSQ